MLTWSKKSWADGFTEIHVCFYANSAIIPTTKPIVRVILKIISFNVLHTLYVYNYADKNILHLPICRGIPSTETHRIGTTF